MNEKDITMENYRTTRFRKAKIRVENIKGFYRHLTVYITINSILIIGKGNVLAFFVAQGAENPGFLRWVDWNVMLSPLLWGVGLLVHALYVFKFKSMSVKELKPKVLRDWEEKQIQKYMEEEN